MESRERGDDAIKRLRLIPFLAAFLLVCLAAVAARAAAIPDSWRQAAHDPAKAEAVRVSIDEEKIRAGVWNLTPLAMGLADAAAAEYNPARAKALMALAVYAAPDTSILNFRLAAVELRSGSYLGAAQAVWGGVEAMARDPWVAITLTVYGLILLTVAGGITGTALLAAAIPYHLPRALHDCRDFFPFEFRRVSPWAAAAFLAIVLIAIGPGLLVFIFLPAVLILLYLPRRVQVTMGVCLALGALSFPAFSYLSHLAGPAGDRAFLLYRVWRGDQGVDLGERISAAFGEENARGLTARAALARRAGDFDGALALLDRAESAGVRGGIIPFERGNLLFLKGDLESAEKMYTAAAESAPDDWIVFYNTALLHTLGLDMIPAEQAMAKARALDSKATEQQAVHGPKGLGRFYPAFRDIPSEWISAEIRDATVNSRWVSSAWSFLGSPHKYLHPVHAAVFILFMMVLAVFASKKGLTARCSTCGALRCPRCHRTVKEADVCSGCWVLRQGVSVDETSRERVRRAVAVWGRRVRRTRKVAGLLLPGWNRFVYEGMGGAAVGVVWSLAAASILVGAILTPPLLPWRQGWFPWTSVVVFVLLYIPPLAKLRPKR